jgi:hypothetical protein
VDVSWVLWLSEKGSGEGHPPVANGVELSAAGWPVYGVKRASTCPVPHASGLASGAGGPPSNRMTRSLNGSGGLPANVASRRPVAGLGVTRPLSLTDTP